MTVPATTSSIAYTADGTTAVFPYTWEIAAAADLIVYTVAVGATVAVKLALTAGYTVSGAGIATGGNVTLVAGNPVVGTRVFIASDPALIQQVLLEQGIAFNPADVMAALDLLTRQVQAARRIADGSMQIPVAESLAGYGMTLPLASARAGKFAGFDGAGNAAVLSGVFTGVAIETTVQVVDTIAQLKALAAPAVALSYFVRGYGAAGDGGGGFFRWNAADGSADNAGTIIQPNSLPGTGRWNRVGAYSYVIDLTTFGAKGDDATNDATAIQNALNIMSAAGGGVVIGKPGATYKCNTAPVIPTRTTLDLLGATLHLTLSGSLEGVTFRDDSEIRNGTVTVSGSGSPGVGGNWQVPLVIGGYTSNTGYKDVRIRNLSVSGDRANSNGILVTGPSHDVLIENVRFPSSSTIADAIVVHWASDGANPPALTTHPYDIRIANVQAGAMTNTTAGGAIVYLSGCYNVAVDNVACDQAAVSVATATIGDYGGEYGGAAIKPLVGKGIRLRGLSGKLCNKYGVYVDSWEDNFGGSPIVSMPIVFEDCMFVGDGTATATAGLRTVKQHDAVFRNCEATLFVNGVDVDDSCARVRIEGGRYYANRADGILIDHSNVPTDCAVIGVESYGNGTDGGAGSCAGIRINNAVRARVERCLFGDVTSEATQVYGVRLDGTNTVAASIINNYVRNTKAAGVAYVIGDGSTYGCCALYVGNGCNPAIATLYAGQTHVPVEIIPSPTAGVVNVVLFGVGTPAVGTFARGDRTLEPLPSSGGHIGNVCTSGGTPGTWKTYGVIS